MGKKIPLIDSFEAFTEFNSNLHYKANMKGIRIKYADCHKNIICYTEGKQEHCCSLDVFMLNFVKTQGGIIKKGEIQMNEGKEMPLIDSYESFEEFNNMLAHNSNARPIELVDINYASGILFYMDYQTKKVLSIEAFLLRMIGEQNFYIFAGLEYLAYYDFTKIYFRTHRNVFSQRLQDYTSSLMLIDEKQFELWDFTLSIQPDGYKLVAYSGNREVTGINVPEGITSIGPGALSQLKKLWYVNLPSSLKRIDKWAFERDVALERIEIPDSVEYIGESAFTWCKRLKHVKLPSKLKVIKPYTFEFCLKLEEIAIPSSVETIEYSAFYGCKELKKVDAPKVLVRPGTRDSALCGTPLYYADSEAHNGELMPF